jgi:hypothetical protein
MNALNKTRAALLVAGLLAAAGTALAAPSLLLDRGLPTANVNADVDGNPATAAADRSNVAWYSNSYTNATSYGVLGDTITNTSGQTWFIQTLRMWTFEPFEVGSTPRLFGGLLGGADYVQLSSAAAITSGVTYANGANYVDVFGSDTPLWQVDFTVNIQLDAGQTLAYFFDGDVDLPGSPTFAGPPGLHASNGPLSGSPQQGSDGFMLEAELVNGSIVMSTVTTWTSNVPTQWDKASDFNVQAFGDVPEPASLALVGLALAAAGAARRGSARR